MTRLLANGKTNAHQSHIFLHVLPATKTEKTPLYFKSIPKDRLRNTPKRFDNSSMIAFDSTHHLVPTTIL